MRRLAVALTIALAALTNAGAQRATDLLGTWIHVDPRMPEERVYLEFDDDGDFATFVEGEIAEQVGKWDLIYNAGVVLLELVHCLPLPPLRFEVFLRHDSLTLDSTEYVRGAPYEHRPARPVD